MLCTHTYTLYIYYIYCRLITRAALIHLKRVDDRDPEEQDRLDLAIKRAKAAASGAAGLIIAVGKYLTSDRSELVTKIMPKVKSIVPNSINRVQFSYSLIIYAALKVQLMSESDISMCDT
jgi:hypothetical protein